MQNLSVMAGQAAFDLIFKSHVGRSAGNFNAFSSGEDPCPGNKLALKWNPTAEEINAEEAEPELAFAQKSDTLTPDCKKSDVDEPQTQPCFGWQSLLGQARPFRKLADETGRNNSGLALKDLAGVKLPAINDIIEDDVDPLDKLPKDLQAEPPAEDASQLQAAPELQSPFEGAPHPLKVEAALLELEDVQGGDAASLTMEPPAKRVKKTFAARLKPRPAGSLMRWEAVSSAYFRFIEPKIWAPSKHEGSFWKFCHMKPATVMEQNARIYHASAEVFAVEWLGMDEHCELLKSND